MEASTWQLLLDHLTKALQLSGDILKFKSKKTDAERVKFCGENKLITDKLDQWLKTNSQTTLKDSRLSLQLKTEGNKAYVNKNDNRALQLYNEALLNCSEDDIALLYGNRSAVLFNKGLWEDCVTDIDVALTTGFPHGKLWKLYKRKGEALYKLHRVTKCIACFEKCIKLFEEADSLMKEKEKVLDLLHNIKNNDFININQESSVDVYEHKLVPLNGFSKEVTSASRAILLCQNEMEGRHFVANETIECGSIVIAEKPYASVLLPQWFKSHCQHCLSKVTTLFPCKQCTDICYCSTECANESWKSYHHFECGKLHIMEKIGVSHLALRIILVSDMETLSCFFDNSEIQSHDMKGCNEDGVYKSTYESLYHLITHSEDLPVEDLFQYAVAGLMLLKILWYSDIFSFKDHRLDSSDNTRYQIGGLLLRHIQQIVCNAHAITSIESTSNVSVNIVEQDQVRIATALYATSSILNHSCSPNILNTFHKDKLIVKVIKAIHKGEHVYTCYGPHYRRMDFTERQNALKGQYFFECKCEHCLKGSKSMEEFDCFCCPKCQQSIHSEEKMCVYCSTNVDSFIDKYNQKSAEAMQLFSSALCITNKEQNSNAIDCKAINIGLTKFLSSLKIQEEIYFKFHSSLGKTYDAIAKCYAMLYNYPECIVYIKKSIQLVKLHYGDESAEVTNEYLKLCDVYLELMQTFIDNKNYKGIRQFHSESLRAVEEGIKLVQLNKEPDSSDFVDLKCKHESLIKLGFMNLS